LGEHLIDEPPDQRLGREKVRDRTALQRPDHPQPVGRFAFHRLGFGSDRHDFIGSDIVGDNRRFADDHSGATFVGNGVGGP